MPRVKKTKDETEKVITKPAPLPKVQKLNQVWFCQPIYWDEDWHDNIMDNVKYTMYIEDSVLILGNNKNQDRTFVPLSNVRNWN